MLLIKMFLNELEQEAVSTRKMLKIVPTEKFDWQPHPKSMTVKALATHIAEIPAWIYSGLTTDGLDFAKNSYAPTPIKNTSELMELLETSLNQAKSQLIEENENKLNDRWVMRIGDIIYMDITKAELIRHSLSQLIHHRAQLGVFLRLLDIPIPGCYGPSADDKGQ
jgi:uncharacterized damage-inducible protein DinB